VPGTTAQLTSSISNPIVHSMCATSRRTSHCEHQKPSLSKPKSDCADGVLRCCFFVIWEVSAAQPDSAASDELSIGCPIGGRDMGLRECPRNCVGRNEGDVRAYNSRDFRCSSEGF
jgi:hypothetical protein